MAAGRWRLNICGINHKTASVEEREPLGFGRDEIAEAHAEFAALEQVYEAVIVSTCNRVEFYFLSPRTADPFDIVFDFFDRIRDINIYPLRDKFYVHRAREAATHLLRVAGGLDSMVIGENQILGQIKDAYSSACAVKATGKVMHRLFHQAFRVGKQIRADTEVGRGCCSVSSAAMELLQSRIAGIEEPAILFVGVNQMIDLAAANLSRVVHGPFMFANRTADKAERLAGRYDGEGYGLDQLPHLLEQADVVVSCTGSPQPIIDGEALVSAVKADPRRPLIVMDMAIPRDVAGSPEGDTGIEVYDLEDVNNHVRRQQARREAAIPEAEEIIDRRLDEFIYWYDHARRQPAAKGAEELYEIVRREEFRKILAELPEDAREKVESAGRSLVRRLVQLSEKNCSKCSKSE